MAANGKPGSSSYTPLSSSSLSSDSSSLFSSFPSPSSAATVPGGYRYPAFKRFNRINLRFKISYYTQWGQNLMISGSDLLLGRWNVKQGVWMTPHHEGEFLVWQVGWVASAGYSLAHRSPSPAVVPCCLARLQRAPKVLVRLDVALA